jgi:hypothetical protein
VTSPACRTAAERHGRLNVRVRWRAVPLRRGSWPSRGRTPRP